MPFTVIRHYNNYIPANIALGMLRSNGIECALQDENLSTIQPLWNIANGGIKLLVEEKQVKEAEELLQKAEAQQTEGDFDKGYFY